MAQKENTTPEIQNVITQSAQEDTSGVPVLSAVPKDVDPAIVQKISEQVAREYRMAVFHVDESEKILHVAMEDPQNVDALNVLRFLVHKDGLRINRYQASEEVIEDFYKFYEGTEKAIESVVSALESDTGTLSKNAANDITRYNNTQQVQDAPVAKLVQVIIRHAVEGGASDIHVEPIDRTYRVRFRVDGLLHASLTFPREVGKAVVSRIKILANLKIDEKRKPQDGRFRITENGHPIDFRVSTLPVVEGEKVVLRVLEKNKQTFNLTNLGLMGSQKDLFLEHIKDPYGMILMTGPTGSGKSTTLYAFLKILNGEDGNIITLEDPVEYFIPGINQSQVKPEIGYTFASGLRSILRQDPDIIMVGEIRDSETAELATHAALTGHLVFSTVHTNSAIGAIPRLTDMGIEPFLIASSVRVIAAQRLLRRICQDCKEEVKISENIVASVREEISSLSDEEITAYGLTPGAPLRFYKGAGCEKCGKLGLKGRIAIYEAISVDDDLQNMISSEEGAIAALEDLTKGKQYTSIKQDGILKALLGLTTLTELERVTEGTIMVGGKIDEINDDDEKHNEKI